MSDRTPVDGLPNTWRKQERTLRKYGGETPAVAIDHLVREGKIPNSGRPGAPRIARRHVPQKSGVATPRLAPQTPRRDVSTVQIVRSVVNPGG